jgi:hypothetical protein
MAYKIDIRDEDVDALKKASLIVAEFTRSVSKRIAADSKMAMLVQNSTNGVEVGEIQNLHDQHEDLFKQYGPTDEFLERPEHHLITLRIKARLMNIYNRVVGVEKLAAMAKKDMFDEAILQTVAKYDGLADSALVKVIRYGIEERNKPKSFSPPPAQGPC